ncbi:conserved hypothetical protein [Ixodes scapularis]|uniref:Uncharacterized protein n=1 Tax=Ixodes scapularis TaxID=6945 RepID=B7QIR4_IXOSC|nr:conserved hypothetical protein [Ixodes scapularis]|eukprot:XP_002415071.1 conserved hypothetical protein [Ixodes scapularis]
MQNSEEEVRRRVEEIYDLIKDIRDPEKPQTLEELGVVAEDDIRVDVQEHYSRVSVTLTVCNTEYQSDTDPPLFSPQPVSKQINDKERVAAAMENKNIRKMVDGCVSYEGC